MFKNLVYFITHPAALSLPISIIVILLLPPVFDRFMLEEITRGKEAFVCSISFPDLDGDSFSEKILYNEFLSPHPIISVFKNEKIVDQWSFQGRLILNKGFLYCDYDSDGIKEIFVFTIENDSIFFYGINPFTKDEHHFFRKFVHKVNKKGQEYDVGLNFCSSPDVDGNGFKEIVVSIYTGFTLTPRNLFLIDIANDTVLESPESGTAIISPLAFDLDNDGHDEYMGESGAFGNWQSEVDYKDDKAWLMVIDKNMKFVFDPIPFGEYKTYVQAVPLKTAGKTEIVILQKHYGPEYVKNKLMLFDVGGNKIKEKVLSDHGDVKNLFMVSTDKRERDRLSLFSEGGKVEQLDRNLNLSNPVFIKNIETKKPERMDIDLDGIIRKTKSTL